MASSPSLASTTSDSLLDLQAARFDLVTSQVFWAGLANRPRVLSALLNAESKVGTDERVLILNAHIPRSLLAKRIPVLRDQLPPPDVLFGTDASAIRRSRSAAEIEVGQQRDTHSKVALTQQFSLDITHSLELRESLEQAAREAVMEPTGVQDGFPEWIESQSIHSVTHSTLLLEAIAFGCQETALYLIGLRDVNLNVPTTSPPLHIAVAHSRPQIVRALLDTGVVNEEYFENSGLLSPLHIAAAHGDYAVLHTLLVHSSLDVDTPTPIEGVLGGLYTPLMLASKNNHLSCVLLLIEAGARLDVHRADGMTALFIAAHEGHDEVAQVLLDAGATTNPPASSPGWWEVVVRGYLTDLRERCLGGVGVAGVANDGTDGDGPSRGGGIDAPYAPGTRRIHRAPSAYGHLDMSTWARKSYHPRPNVVNVAHRVQTRRRKLSSPPPTAESTGRRSAPRSKTFAELKGASELTQVPTLLTLDPERKQSPSPPPSSSPLGSLAQLHALHPASLDNALASRSRP